MANRGRKQPEVSTPPDRVVPPRRRRGPAELRPEHLYKAVGLFFLLLFFYRFFPQIVQTLLLIYAAAIAGVVFNVVIRAAPLQRRWMAVVIGVSVLGTVGAMLWFGVPALLGQLRDLSEQAPAMEALVAQAEVWLRESTGLNVRLLGPEVRQFFQDALSPTAGGNLIGQVGSVLGALFVPVVILFGGLYAASNPNDRLLSPILRVVPRDMRLAYRRIFELLGVRIVAWLKGTLIGMVGVGLLSFAAYSLLGVPNALLLAVLAGLFEFVVLVGPWIGGIAAVLVAFVHDPTLALWTVLAALVIQQIESNIITPWAMSAAADIHPFVTLFALIFFGSLFGLLGILLAVPLVLLFWTVIEVLWVERVLDADEDHIAPVVRE
jgi:predicted PurR-regulated permease PerM